MDDAVVGPRRGRITALLLRLLLLASRATKSAVRITPTGRAPCFLLQFVLHLISSPLSSCAQYRVTRRYSVVCEVTKDYKGGQRCAWSVLSWNRCTRKNCRTVAGALIATPPGFLSSECSASQALLLLLLLFVLFLLLVASTAATIATQCCSMVFYLRLPYPLLLLPLILHHLVQRNVLFANIDGR